MTRTCETCGAELRRHPKHSRAQWEAKRFCDRACAAARLRKPRFCTCGCGQRPPRRCKYVPGHRRLTPSDNGYLRVFVPGHPMARRDGLALQHRVVLHDAGVTIPPGAQVHHRNGDRADNRLENLEVVSPREHTLRHIAERGYVENQFGIWPVAKVGT